MAVISSGREKDFVLEHLEYRATTELQDASATLKKMVTEASLKGMPAVFVMEPRYYSLMQVEAPEVNPEEMKNAVRWRIKDLIDFHIDDAAIDLVMLPQSKRVGAPKLMYVIATRASYIESVVKALEDAGLDIKAIDVTELALRNMTFADAQENRATAFLYLSRQLSLIEICENGCLCLSRHISVDADRFDTETAEGRTEMMDVLSLEIQRSLDYYESQFANGAAAQLNLVSQCAISVDEFSDVAGSYLTVPISALSSLEIINGADQYDQHLLASCLPAIGGAMREFAWRS